MLVNLDETSMHILTTISTDNTERLREMEPFLDLVDDAVSSVGAQNLGKVSHKFPDAGFTVVVCLAESHIAVHTWPELGKVTMDVYLCNFQHDNTEKCERIFDKLQGYFDPTEANVTRLLR